MDKNYNLITFILKRPRVANFADIITLLIMTQKILKELEIMY